MFLVSFLFPEKERNHFLYVDEQKVGILICREKDFKWTSGFLRECFMEVDELDNLNVSI